jgi:hypothetical protein
MIFQAQQNEPYYVFGLRCFYLWVYSRAMKEEDRNPAQQAAVAEYIMPDWFANILSVIGIHSEENFLAKKNFPTLRREAIGYDPERLAQLIQYREFPIRGCNFIDAAYSLDARQVRGHNLQLVLNIRPRHVRTEGPTTSAERAIRLQIDKHFIEIAISPGYYARRIQELGLSISLIGLPQHWPDRDNVDISLDDFIVWMTKCGVTPAMVDDSFEYARAWVFNPDPVLPHGWTSDEVESLLSLPDGFPEPPSMDTEGTQVYTRSPFTPWHHTPDNVVQYDLSFWVMEELDGLRRPLDSKIAKHIREKKPRPVQSSGLVKRVNPFVPDTDEETALPGLSAEETAQIFARNNINSGTGRRGTRGRGGGYRGASTSRNHYPRDSEPRGSTSRDRSISSSMHAPMGTHPVVPSDFRAAETRYHSSPDALRRANESAQFRASTSSTSRTNSFTFGQIVSEPLTATEQNLNLEDVVSKVGNDIRNIDREYKVAVALPTNLEI